MGLSSDLITQFIKSTRDNSKRTNEESVYGVVSEQNGEMYVKLDGSDVYTPIGTSSKPNSTVKIKDGDRVVVRIKNHAATITGNITNQSAGSQEVEVIEGNVGTLLEVDELIAKYLDVDLAKIDELIAQGITVDKLYAKTAEIDDLYAKKAEIDELVAERIEAKFLEVDYITADDLVAIEADINNLTANYAKIESLEAAIGEIDDLYAKKADIESLSVEYAKIDFANIGGAAITNLIATSGIIGDLIVSEGNITDTLNAVGINADWINAGTLKAEHLVLLGEDGLFHEINVKAGEITEGEVVPEDGIHGSAIVANSITAAKMAVDDLVAFDATIGGFNIGINSLYSGVKQSIDNSTPGIYMDTDGQVYFGDADNYLRYRKHPFEEPVELTLTPNKILAPANGSVSDFNNPYLVTSDPVVITDCDSVVITAFACVNRYAYAFYDSNDTFITGLAIPELASASTGITNTVVSVPDGAVSLRIAGDMSFLPPVLAKVRYKYKLAISADSILFGANSKSSVADLQALTEHVKLGTYVDDTGNERPSIELAEGDTGLKQVITNIKTMFMDGDNVGTEINTDGLETENVTVRSELRQGNWVWAQRGNGNYGLIWKEATA